MKKANGILLLILLCAYLIIGLPTANPNAQGGQPVYNLFSDVSPTIVDELNMRSAQKKKDITIVRSRFVHVNFDYLNKADAVVLNLFPDMSVIADLKRLVRRDKNSYSWFGHINSMEISSVILTIQNGNMAGNIAINDKFYQVRPAGTQIHSIREIDQSAFPEDDCAPPIEELGAKEQERQSTLPRVTGDSGSIIDVMVVYTQDAANASFNIDAEIQLAIDETNDSYINSFINPRIKLVHTAQVNYTETGNISLDVSRLQNPADGYMDEVHTWRNQYGADMVALIVENGGFYCGIAYAIMSPVTSSFEDKAFCVVDRGCSTGNYTFGHELGHLQSARHDWFVDWTDNSPFTYNHGYVSPNYDWRTVMAYSNACFGCSRILYWSNPDVLFGGLPMGVLEGQFQAADNRKTLNNTAFTVANFRQSATASFLDVPPGFWAEDYIYAIFDAGITTGCSQNPLRYCPLDPVTRAQMAAFIIRAVEGEPDDNLCATGSPFSDVSPASTFCKYIKRLSELEITTGCGGGNYCPNDMVTRAQMAAFIIRAVEGEPDDNLCATGSPFSDVSPATTFCKYIKRLSELGITTGCGGDNYCPNDIVTRAQMAAFLARAFLNMQ